MKLIVLLLIIWWIFSSCSPADLVKPNPTGFSEQDFALQAYITTSNIAYCNREKNLEKSVDGYICLETGSDKVFYVPLHKWEEGVKYDFTLYSKNQVTELLDVLKNFCDKIPSACKEVKTEPLLSLRPYLVK